MLTLPAKYRFFWTLRLSGRLLEETRRRARWKVARIQSPVSVRYQHALKTPCQLLPKRRGELAPTYAFARHVAIRVAIDIYWVVVEDAKLPTAFAREPNGGLIVLAAFPVRNADRRLFAYNRKLLGWPTLRTHGALHTHNNTQLRGRNRHARPEQNYSPSRAANGRRGRRLGGGRRTRRAGASAAEGAATQPTACAGGRQDHLGGRADQGIGIRLRRLAVTRR